MAAPWLKTTTRPPGCAAAMRSMARRSRPPKTSRDSAPGITSQRCSRHDLVEDGVAVGCLHAQQAALPLAEEHLAQIGLDHRRHPAAGHQGRRRLGGALQGGDVERVEGLAGQPQAHLLGLVPAGLGERRVALPLDEFEGLALDASRPTRRGGRATARWSRAARRRAAG